jgi:hypothetical protein
MTIVLILAAFYVMIATFALWFMVHMPSKSGHRVTMSGMMEAMRREGMELVLLSLLWLPILSWLIVMWMVDRIGDRGIRE